MGWISYADGSMIMISTCGVQNSCRTCLEARPVGRKRYTKTWKSWYVLIPSRRNLSPRVHTSPSQATDPPPPSLPAYDVENEVVFEPDPHPTGIPPAISSVTAYPLPTGCPPSSVAPAPDSQPRADLPGTEATPAAKPPVSPESIPGSQQSTIFESQDLTSPLIKSSPSREVGDRPPSEGPDSPRLEYSPSVPSKFD
jgi:hypothetical protein